MRRKDRQITDTEKICTILDNCHCCRIGFNDNGQVYIVPLNFGYEYNEKSYVFYFHSAKEGRKIDLVKAFPNVGFELDTGYQLKEADIACDYSAKFQSIIGNGVASIVEDMKEKENGLRVIMQHNTGKKDWEFNPNMLQNVCVIKLIVTEISCKEHL